MDHNAAPAYGLWSLVVINSLVFIIFAFSFTKPRTARDWRPFGAFSAFLLALYGNLATREEADMAAQFGKEYEIYAAKTPRFIPRPSSNAIASQH